MRIIIYPESTMSRSEIVEVPATPFGKRGVRAGAAPSAAWCLWCVLGLGGCFEPIEFEPRAVADALVGRTDARETANAAAVTDVLATTDVLPTPDVLPTTDVGRLPGPDAHRECAPDVAPVPCWPDEFAAQRGLGQCMDGWRACGPDGRWSGCEGAVLPGVEVPGNALDEDCDGVALPWETVRVERPNDHDCSDFCCPETHPYPAGCELDMGRCDTGCIAWQPGSTCIFAQEGDICSSGTIEGHLVCSNDPDAVIDENTCVTSCDETLRPPSEEGCP
jgi:hypothetical protein